MLTAICLDTKPAGLRFGRKKLRRVLPDEDGIGEYRVGATLRLGSTLQPDQLRDTAEQEDETADQPGGEIVQLADTVPQYETDVESIFMAAANNQNRRLPALREAQLSSVQKHTVPQLALLGRIVHPPACPGF